MTFQLSPGVDKNKIFLINRSELDGRLDPSSYSIRNIFVNSLFPLEKVSKYFFINPPQQLKIKKDDIYSFIPMKNISGANATIKKVGAIKGIKTKGYTPFNKGDFVFAKITPCMENGKMAVIKNLPHSTAFGSTEFHVFREKNKLSVDYLRSLFLIDRFRDYAKCNFIGTSGHRRVPPEFFYKLKIPIPPKEIQNEIVTKMDAAYASKKRNEAEAQRLLDGIDDYLLGELGIEMPEQAENTLESRIFDRQLSEVSGGRFDPKYYESKYIVFDKRLNYSAYDVVDMGSIITSVVSGSTPKAGGSAYENNGEHYFIRLTNFDDDMNIDLKKSLFIKEKTHDNYLKRSRLIKGDVLFGIAGSIGKIAIYNHNEKANINQAIARIRFKKCAHSVYIAYLLNSIILKYQIERNKRPVAQPNINTEELKSLKIPLPPLAKQNEIANHISAIRTQAKQLQQQAKAGLAQAKKEVEAMILGEDAIQK